MGRRLRSSRCPAQSTGAPRMTCASAGRLCQNRGDGTHLVWADVRPACAARTPSSSPIRIQSVVGPTGRGITGDIVTFSHPDDRPLPRAKGKRSRDGRDAPAVEPGRRVRPRRPGRVRGQGGPGHRRPDLSRRRARGRDAASRSSFVVEVDGVHTIHLGDIGHLLSEEKLGDIGAVDIACVPLGGTAVARPGPPRSSPSSTRRSSSRCRSARTRRTAPRRSAQFFHEMGAEPATQPKLSVTATSLPPRRPRSCSSRAASRPDARPTRRRSAPVEHDPPALDDRPHEVGAPASTGSASDGGTRQITRSAALPGSSDPISSSSPSARAALIVTAAERLVGRHPQLEAGDGHRQRQARRRRGARVEVRADARPACPRR